MEIIIAVLIIYAIYKNDHNSQIIVDNQIEIRNAIKGIEESLNTPEEPRP